MKQILIFFFIIILYQAHGQEYLTPIVSESPKFNNKRKNDKIDIIDTSIKDKSILLRNREKEIVIDLLDKKLNKSFSHSIKKNKQEKFLGHLTINNNLKIFTENYPKRSTKIISCYNIDLTNKNVIKSIISQSKVNLKLTLFENIKISKYQLAPNKNHFSILNAIVHKNTIYFDLKLFNSLDNKIIFEKSFERPENNDYQILEMELDNYKNINILSRSCFNQNKPSIIDRNERYHMLEKLNYSNHLTKIIKLQDIFIRSLKPVFKDNYIHLFGLYSKRGVLSNGICKLIINKKKLSIENTDFINFPEEAYNKLFNEKKIKGDSKLDLKDFYLHKIISADNNFTYVIAQEYYFVDTGNTSYPHYGDIVIVKLNNQNECDWGKLIAFSDTKRTFHSFVDTNNHLHFILNAYSQLKKDNRGLIKAYIPQFRPNNSSLYDFCISSNGLKSIRKIHNNKESSLYSPQTGNDSNGKFIMLSDSKKILRFMSLEYKTIVNKM